MELSLLRCVCWPYMPVWRGSSSPNHHPVTTTITGRALQRFRTMFALNPTGLALRVPSHQGRASFLSVTAVWGMAHGRNIFHSHFKSSRNTTKWSPSPSRNFAKTSTRSTYISSPWPRWVRECGERVYTPPPSATARTRVFLRARVLEDPCGVVVSGCFAVYYKSLSIHVSS